MIANHKIQTKFWDEKIVAARITIHPCTKVMMYFAQIAYEHRNVKLQKDNNAKWKTKREHSFHNVFLKNIVYSPYAICLWS